MNLNLLDLDENTVACQLTLSDFDRFSKIKVVFVHYYLFEISDLPIPNLDHRIFQPKLAKTKGTKLAIDDPPL